MQRSPSLQEDEQRANFPAWPSPFRILRRVLMRSLSMKRSTASSRSGTTSSTNLLCRSRTGNVSSFRNGLKPTAPIPLPDAPGARFGLSSSASFPHRVDPCRISSSDRALKPTSMKPWRGSFLATHPWFRVCWQSWTRYLIASPRTLLSFRSRPTPSSEHSSAGFPSQSSSSPVATLLPWSPFSITVVDQ